MDLSLYSAMGKNDKYYTAYSSSISTVTSLNPNETLKEHSTFFGNRLIFHLP